MNSMLDREEELTDSPLWDIWLSRYHLVSVAIADKLNLFEIIGNNSITIEEIANQLNMEPMAVEALTCLVSSLKFLDKNQEYLSLNDLSRKFLLPQTQYYWGGVTFAGVSNTPEYKRTWEALTVGKGLLLGANQSSYTEMWESGNVDLDAASIFTSIMQATTAFAATLAIGSGSFNGVKHLLDVGGASGFFASSFITLYPDSKATIFELPQICNIYSSEVPSQITFHAGNFFKDALPSGIDAILFSNIMHDWDKAKIEYLLAKAYGSLPPKGKIYIHEMLLNEERNGPVTAASFNLLMYINHRSQQLSYNELANSLKAAGFHEIRHTNTHPLYSLIVAEKL